jgi:3-deoxy-D-manno-octulosonic-acid transferase
MQILYNLSIILFGKAIQIASIFNEKAKNWTIGRKNWRQNLPVIDSTKELVWFHCASLGEFDQGLPVMKEWKAQNPAYLILVSFFSPSGMQHYQKRNHCADYVVYLPLDIPSNARYFLNYFAPKAIFFVKYEFWANYISAAHTMQIPLYSIAANFRENQHFFCWYGSFFRSVLKRFTYFFVQTENSKNLLQSIGITNIQVTGDTRFDAVLEMKNQFVNHIKEGRIDDDWTKFERFLQGEKAIIIGSSWPSEEELIIPYILKNKTTKFILAPHDISEDHILKIEQALNNESIRFTRFINDHSDVNCLILDTIGHLSKAYYFGKIAIVGGGFSGKLHNILEPTVFGLPVLFGPKHDRFPEANLLLSNNVAFEFENENELVKKLNDLVLKNPIPTSEIQLFIASQAGAAAKIISTIGTGL